MTTAEKRAELLNDMCDLGQMCFDDGDVDEALRWLNLAASLGSDRANCALDDMYYYNFDAPRYTLRAAEYLNRNWSNKLVLSIRSKKYRPQTDSERVVRFLTEPASGGDDWACFALSCMYLCKTFSKPRVCSQGRRNFIAST